MTLADGQSRAEVRVASTGKIQDPEFVRLLEKIGRERLAAFPTEDFLVLDLVHREQPVPEFLKPRLEPLLEQGLIDRIGRGRGVRYLPSRRFYTFLGKPGVYTRRRGLDRETNKALAPQAHRGCLFGRLRDGQAPAGVPGTWSACDPGSPR